MNSAAIALTQNSANRGAAKAVPHTFPSRAEGEDAAKNFEALFLRQIVKDMRKSAEVMGEGGLFGKGEGSGIKESWFDDMFASHMSGSGQVGLADALVDDWARNGHLGTKEKQAIATAKKSVTDFPYNTHNNQLLELQVQDRILKNIP